jgi:hypothetical protein
MDPTPPRERWDRIDRGPQTAPEDARPSAVADAVLDGARRLTGVIASTLAGRIVTTALVLLGFGRPIVGLAVAAAVAACLATYVVVSRLDGRAARRVQGSVDRLHRRRGLR